MATARTVTKNRAGQPISRPAPAPVEAFSDLHGKQQAPEREPAREPARAAIPHAPGRTVVTNRAGQPVSRASAASGVNQFAISEELIRKVRASGWDWEWKAELVNGLRRDEHLAEMYQVGWEPVRYESYPGVFSPEFTDDGEVRKGPVRRLGMMLMERDLRLTAEAKRDEKRKADDRVNGAKMQYRAGPDTSGTSTAVYDDTARRIAQTNQFTEQVVMPNERRQPVDN